MIGTLRKHFGIIALTVAVAWTAVWTASCARSPQAQEARFLEDGKTRLLKKDYAKALLQFRSAIQVAPQDAEAHYQFGLASIKAGDVAVGIAQLRRATELNPKHYGAQVERLR
jgi:Flp pilus assembly protein TadD